MKKMSRMAYNDKTDDEERRLMLRRQVIIVRCLQVRNIVQSNLTPRLPVKRAGVGNNDIEAK
jgi:hypothetical protein